MLNGVPFTSVSERDERVNTRERWHNRVSTFTSAVFPEIANRINGFSQMDLIQHYYCKPEKWAIKKEL
jgi:hypothetical protein